VRNTKDVTSLMETLKQPSDQGLVASVSDWLIQPSVARSDIEEELAPVLPEGDPVPAPAIVTSPPTVIASNPPEVVPQRTHRDELLDQLSGEYSSSALARSRIRKDIESQLIGVPDAAAISALEDWLADLEAARQAKLGRTTWDPDPSTSSTTSLKARIDRQTARDIPGTGDDQRLR
jgi:hypothetical protein